MPICKQRFIQGEQNEDEDEEDSSDSGTEEMYDMLAMEEDLASISNGAVKETNFELNEEEEFTDSADLDVSPNINKKKNSKTVHKNDQEKISVEDSDDVQEGDRNEGVKRKLDPKVIFLLKDN